MTKLLSCRYNMDTNRVEARFEDGTTVAINCIAIEDEYGDTPAQRAELDWLLYNKPLEYAQMVLGGRWGTTCRWDVTMAGWRTEPQKTRGKIANRAARVFLATSCQAALHGVHSSVRFHFSEIQSYYSLFYKFQLSRRAFPRMKNARPCDFGSQFIRGQLDLFALCSRDYAFSA